jgi:hypothetical protein
MEKVRILIAEDNIEARNILIEGINEYSLKVLNDNNLFEIVWAESFVKAWQILLETSQNQNFFDIFFCDIDFTEDNRGGERDSGYKLIEKSFEIYPLTKILTYSGQFRAKDLWPKYEELEQKGLIVYTMDKSHSEGGEEKWLFDRLSGVINQMQTESYLKDVWINHNNVIKKLDSLKLDEDSFGDTNKKKSIITNLDAILILLKNSSKFKESLIIHRLIIYLYQSCLEIICRGKKTEEEILKLSDINKPRAKRILNRKIIFPKSVNAQRILISYLVDEKMKFGFRLNDYRNKSIHQNNDFRVDFANVIFSNLAFSLYLLDRKEVKFQLIVDSIKKSTIHGKGIKNLKEIINYISL